MRNLVIILALLFNVSSALEVAIPENLQAKVSAKIVDSQTGLIIYEHNQNIPRLIASNVKLFTTLFALENLKNDFQWHTKLLYSGKIENNILNGNLYLQGSGDPTLDDKAIYLIFSQLKRLGINRVNGNIIFDNNIFNGKPTYSMLESLEYDSDTVLPDGLIINNNLVNFYLNISADHISLTSNLYNYTVNNRLVLENQATPCTELYKRVKLELNNNIVSLSGKISPSCQNKTLAYNLFPPFIYNQMIISKVLNDLNINISGSFNVGITPNLATIVYDYPSINLEQALINMNYFSNNLIAETLLLTISANRQSNNLNTNTFAIATQLYKQFLQSHNLLNSQFKLENGAGVSRYEYFTADNIVQLLYLVNKLPIASKFEATLPEPGMEGTLKNLFPELANKLHAKTGTLKDTRVYSGYLYSAKKNKYIVVFIGNNLLTPVEVTSFYELVNKTLKQIDHNNK